MGSGTKCAVAQPPVRLLEGWGKEVYLALVSICAPSCASCGRFTHSIDAGMASYHVPGADRVVLPGAVRWGKNSPVVGIEEEHQEDLTGFTNHWAAKLPPAFEEDKMKRVIFVFVSAVFAFTALAGVAMGQGSPARQPEEQIEEFISRWEKLWNENNPKEMMEMYHPEAKIMYGWGRDKGTASKKEYEGILPGRVKANPSIDLTITKIDVQGEKAKAVVDMKVRGAVTPSTFELIKENDKWLITGFNY